MPRIPSHAPIFCERRILNCWISFHFFNGKAGPFASTEEFLNISRECYWAMSSNHIASHSKALSYKSSGALLKRIAFELESRQQSTAPLPFFAWKGIQTTTGLWKNSATCWLGRPLCLAAFTSIYTYLLLHIICCRVLEKSHIGAKSDFEIRAFKVFFLDQKKRPQSFLVGCSNLKVPTGAL